MVISHFEFLPVSLMCPMRSMKFIKVLGGNFYIHVAIHSQISQKHVAGAPRATQWRGVLEERERRASPGCEAALAQSAELALAAMGDASCDALLSTK